MPSFWTGDRIRLRAIEPDDWTALMRFTAEEERLGDLVQPPRSTAHHRAAAARDTPAGPGAGRGGGPDTGPDAGPDGDRFGLAVEALATGDIVGVLGVHHADARMGWFEYGLTIGAGHRRRGYAQEAVGLLLRFMFAERRYHKCEARIFADNEPSLRLHRRLGFTEEGRLRDHVFADGAHRDLVLVGLLAEEFARRPRGPGSASAEVAGENPA